jgi:hypothetical protein
VALPISSDTSLDHRRRTARKRRNISRELRQPRREAGAPPQRLSIDDAVLSPGRGVQDRQSQSDKRRWHTVCAVRGRWTLAIILSRALLLADDTAIDDPTMVIQIKQ